MSRWVMWIKSPDSQLKEILWSTTVFANDWEQISRHVKVKLYHPSFTEVILTDHLK